MNIQYPVSEILRCVDYINDPKKEIYESSNEILVLNNPLTMKKKTEEIKEKENQTDTENSQPEKENKSLEVHEDDEDTSRIGRSGDLLKREKI